MDPYHRHYGYGMLDDIHNLFPDLLYRDGPTSSEFNYIREQTRMIFPIRYLQGSLEYHAYSSPAIMTVMYPGSRFEQLVSVAMQELQPVIIHPTPEQINSATSLTPHTEVEESILCAICQDHTCPADTNEWREIEVCGHLYHKKCIDRWFETSVNCPICRIDIRET